MVTTFTAADQHAALAVQSRRAMLEVLRAKTSLDVSALAAAVGLHVTTVRFHLEVLEQAGLVRHSSEPPSRPGRPRRLYAAVALGDESENRHQQLSQVLASGLAADILGGPQLAEQAGRRWAVEQVPVEAPTSWDQGTRRVSDLFDRLGFAPRLADDPDFRRLELRGCPFRDVARGYPHIVCSVHLGLLREALDRGGVPRAADAQLRAFVEPELCVVDIARPKGEQVTP